MSTKLLLGAPASRVSGGHSLGVPCPHCNSPYSKVIDVRPAPDRTTRRRRVCPNNHRFTTYECADYYEPDYAI